MISIYAMIFLLASVFFNSFNTSASPLDQTRRVIYRRNDASDDDLREHMDDVNPTELEDLDDYLMRLESQYNALPLGKEEDLDDYLSRIQNYVDAVDQQPITNSVATQSTSRHELENHSRAMQRKVSRNGKPRRTTSKSKDKAGLKTTGLDLDESPKDDRAAKLSDHVEEADNQMNDRGEQSLTNLKDVNRNLLREIANEVLSDPVQEIEDYNEWLAMLINAPNQRMKFGSRIKIKLIMEFFKRKIRDKTGIGINKIHWNRLPADGLIRWPDKTKNFFHLSLNQLNEILFKLDQLNLSQEFLSGIHHPSKSGSLQEKITKYFQDLFQKLINWNKKKIPWDRLNHADFLNWPEGVPVGSSSNLSHEQRKKLNQVLQRIDFTDYFKNTYQERL